MGCEEANTVSGNNIMHLELGTDCRTQTTHLEMGTDNRTQTVGLSDDQQTLLSLLSVGPVHLDPEQAWDVTFAHGPSHQGSNTSLIVHVES